MTLFLDAVIAGIAIGSIYGLVGIGYTVIFKATKVFNLAQGDLVMVGIMLSYLFLVQLRLPQALDAVLVPILVILLALVEERAVVRPFLKDSASGLGWFISTLGFSAVIEGTVALLYGNRAVAAIPSTLPVRGISIGSVTVDNQDLLVVGVFLVTIAVLEAFYQRSWMGQAMRAAAEDRRAATLLGIDPVVMSRAAFVIAGLIAGVTGYVIGPLTMSDPTVGLSFTLKGFLALAIGGFGSIRGAVAGGLALGIGEQVFDLYVSSDYEVLVGLVLVLVVLSVRPEGLFRSNAGRTV